MSKILSLSSFMRSICRFSLSSLVSFTVFAGGGTELPVCKWFRRLMVPYFFFEFLFALLLALLALVSHHDALERFWGCVRSTLLLKGITVTWYLPCLFFAKILFALIGRIRAGVLRAAVLILLFAAGLLCPLKGEWVVLERSFVGLGFISAGYFRKHFLRQASIPVLLGACIVFAVSGLINESVSMVSSHYGNSFLFLLSSVSGSYLLLQLSLFVAHFTREKAKKLMWLQLFGENTLIVLGSHMLVVEIVRLLDYKLFGNMLYRLGIFEGLIFGVIVMLAEIPIIIIMKRYFGFILGSKKG